MICSFFSKTVLVRHLQLTWQAIVDVELFYIEILPVWASYFSCIYECIFKMFEKIKKRKHGYKEFLYLFLQSLFTKILLTEILFFSLFTTLYRIGNIVIITLKLCVFALET